MMATHKPSVGAAHDCISGNPVYWEQEVSEHEVRWRLFDAKTERVICDLRSAPLVAVETLVRQFDGIDAYLSARSQQRPMRVWRRNP